MKKIILFTAIFIVSLCASAFAAQINQNQSASCQDANSIEIAIVKTTPAYKDKFGYTSNDRGTANLVIWKSSNYTTIPLTLGPNDSNKTVMGKDHGRTGLDIIGSMGVSKAVLTHQPKFSRGDSIGDISGLVKITNTGTVPVTVTCK